MPFFYKCIYTTTLIWNVNLAFKTGQIEMFNDIFI